MKFNKVLALVFSVLLLFLVSSCTSVEAVNECVLFNDDSIEVSFKNASDRTIQNFLTTAKKDKTKSVMRNQVFQENRANYSVEQETTRRLNKNFNELFRSQLDSKGFKYASIDETRFVLEGKVNVTYGRNAEGVTWFYDVYITAWDKLHPPLDHRMEGLAHYDTVLEHTTVIDNRNRWPEMSWTTHGEIYALDAESAEKALCERLEKEIENTFVDDFFVF